MDIKVKEVRFITRNTLKAFFTLEIVGFMEIRDCMWHQKNKSEWISYPSKPIIDDTTGTIKKDELGKSIYKNIVVVSDRTIKSQIETKVLDLLRKETAPNTELEPPFES